MYSVGDALVHPLHGAGVIEAIEERRINGEVSSYYAFVFQPRNQRLMMPVSACGELGLRAIISEEDADKVIDDLPEVVCDTHTNWNRRYRENMEQIKSGNLRAVAGVLKGLLKKENAKSLSTAERDVLKLAKQILVSELAVAKHQEYEVMEIFVTETLLGKSKK